MPLMHSHDGKARIVPDRSVSGYLERDWTVAGGQAEVDTKPDQGDRKDAWVAYAQSQGVDTTGMTKDEIVAEVG